ncbi:hypothetical protein CGRA01v4_14269 [Colletotrichum graminicola]|nr:hypothetical protein CGRA01v4_14269 [Colletotrichum graminicola]
MPLEVALLVQHKCIGLAEDKRKPQSRGTVTQCDPSPAIPPGCVTSIREAVATHPPGGKSKTVSASGRWTRPGFTLKLQLVETELASLYEQQQHYRTPSLSGKGVAHVRFHLNPQSCVEAIPSHGKRSSKFGQTKLSQPNGSRLEGTACARPPS